MARSRPKPASARAASRGRIAPGIGDEIGARLRVAREDAGLSQDALGEKLGYQGAMISAFENGRRRLKLEDLARACVALSKDPEFFLRTDALQASEPLTVSLTLRAELAARPDKSLSASIAAFLDAIESELPSEASVPDLTELRPEAAAARVIELCRIDDPPVQMEDVCATLGIPIRRRRFPEALSALIIQISDGEYAIGVNSLHSERRRRFSLAHEVGHAVLAHEAGYHLELSAEDAWEPPDFSYDVEREANQFAAALLMPGEWVREDFNSGAPSIRSLANRYAVSEAAMGFRLINLDLR